MAESCRGSDAKTERAPRPHAIPCRGVPDPAAARLEPIGAGLRRERLALGLACGFLNGGNQDLRRTHVEEVYYRLAISEHFALTADAQYLRNTVASADDPHGFVLGLRATFEF